MRKILTIIVFLAPIFLFSQQKNQDATELPTLVVSGKVVQQESYWSAERSTIYTVNTVEISKIFKGNGSPRFVNVITEGGLVGMEGLIVSHQVQLRKRSKGYFMLQPSDVKLRGFDHREGLFKFQSIRSGFFSYDAFRDEIKLPDAKVKKDEFELMLMSKLNQTPIEKNINLFTESNSASLSSSAEIDQLSPTTIEAGNSQILRISGSGFGTPSGNTVGDVEFKNANDGGDTWLDVLSSQIVSWTDTEIQVEVPDFAGSGKVRVITLDNTTVESPQSIDVPYAISNVNYENIAYPIYHPGSMTSNGLQKDNVQNGKYIFQYNEDFMENEDAVTYFEYALEDWVCNAGINFEISDQATTINEDGRDYVNTISFAGIQSLGVTYQFFSGCSSDDGSIRWIWSDIDILFDSITVWGYDDVSGNQIDFEEVARHEIGHAVGFGHNINSSTLMHFEVSSGDKVFTTDHYLTGSQVILSRDISVPVCGLELHTLSECSSIDPNLDSDGDGVSDILDRCPDTQADEEVNNNGCAPSQLDSDEDGITDDIDQCENTPLGAEVDSVGCSDVDDDGVKDNIDICPDTPPTEQVDSNGCSPSQKDTDEDGVTDDFDQCADTPPAVSVDAYGCSIFTLPADNFKVVVQSRSCPDSNDGLIEIRALDESFTYEVFVGEQTISLSSENGYEYTFNELEVGTYDICFTIIEEPSFEQCFQINLTQPEPLDVYASLSVDSVLFQLQGSTSYNISHNGNLWVHENDFMELTLDKGLNTILISTDLECQGIFEKQYFHSEEVLIHPTVVKDLINFVVGGSDPFIEIEIFDINGKALFKEIRNLENSRSIQLSLKDFSSGIYFVHLHSNTVNKTSKIIKNE